MTTKLHKCEYCSSTILPGELECLLCLSTAIIYSGYLLADNQLKWITLTKNNQLIADEHEKAYNLNYNYAKKYDLQVYNNIDILTQSTFKIVSSNNNLQITFQASEEKKTIEWIKYIKRSQKYATNKQLSQMIYNHYTSTFSYRITDASKKRVAFLRGIAPLISDDIRFGEAKIPKWMQLNSVPCQCRGWWNAVHMGNKIGIIYSKTNIIYIYNSLVDKFQFLMKYSDKDNNNKLRNGNPNAYRICKTFDEKNNKLYILCSYGRLFEINILRKTTQMLYENICITPSYHSTMHLCGDNLYIIEVGHEFIKDSYILNRKMLLLKKANHFTKKLNYKSIRRLPSQKSLVYHDESMTSLYSTAKKQRISFNGTKSAVTRDEKCIVLMNESVRGIAMYNIENDTLNTARCELQISNTAKWIYCILTPYERDYIRNVFIIDDKPQKLYLISVFGTYNCHKSIPVELVHIIYKYFAESSEYIYIIYNDKTHWRIKLNDCFVTNDKMNEEFHSIGKLGNHNAHDINSIGYHNDINGRRNKYIDLFDHQTLLSLKL